MPKRFISSKPRRPAKADLEPFCQSPALTGAKLTDGKRVVKCQENFAHFNVLQTVCASEWTKLTNNIKACISHPPQRRFNQTAPPARPVQQIGKVHREAQTPDVRHFRRRGSQRLTIRRCLSDNSEPKPSKGVVAAVDILTPFQTIVGIKREAPAYWISCMYVRDPSLEKLHLTLRQTGVFPENLSPAAKLTMTVTLTRANAGCGKQVRSVTLRKSGADRTFKSSSVSFLMSNDTDISHACVRFRIYECSLFCKKKVAEWRLPVADCSDYSEKSHWQKVEFQTS